METMEEQKQTKKKESGKMKKIGNLLLSGLVFGIAAGLVMVVILAIFSPQTDGGKDSRGSTGVNEGTQEQAKEAGKADNKKADSAEKQEASEETIRVADATDESQTIVTDVTMVVDHVMPCVVSIFSTYIIEEDFWGYHYDYETEGGGSGIIIGENEAELLIVTNNHVVEDSSELTVQFIDDSVATAVVKGTDKDMDLAIISVDIDELDSSTKGDIRVATLGNSEQLKVGEPAIAIGNALGYGQSVTTGVISAVNRSYTDEEGPVYGGSLEEDKYDDVKYLIQTDAAINPGNSGGALLNVRGEVIGINSSKLVNYTIEGMGYAIPISTALPIIEELMHQKSPQSRQEKGTAYLGVSGAALSRELLERYQLKKGIYITQVFSDTPAKEAGIRKGDILLSIDGMKIGDMKDLSDVLLRYEEGDEVNIKLLKRSNSGYRKQELAVTLGGKE